MFSSLNAMKIPFVQQIIGLLLATTSYNLEQGLGDKFTKLRKIGFSMDLFTADFLRLFSEKA